MVTSSLLLLGSLGATIFLSFFPELVLKPRVGFLQRTLSGASIHILLASLLCLLLFLIIKKPLSATFISLIVLGLFVIVSNAKYKALREPLVFSDLSMFAQAFKHPRLYLPFLGGVDKLLLPIAVLVIFGYLIYQESSVPLTLLDYAGMILVLLVASVVAGLLALDIEFSRDPELDIRRYGLFATLLGYQLQSSANKHQHELMQGLAASVWSDLPDLKSGKPDIVAVQSESFFDARRLHPAIKADVLGKFDQINNEASLYGELDVPAWGANTMRTEFAFLTGQEDEKLGFYRFYPYQYLHKFSVPSLPAFLKQNGYYCVCVHPHAASFFGRDRFFAALGFDEFIDIKEFAGSKRSGPYIADEAVTDKIKEVIDAQDKPVFVFAITMENHGPLHLEQANQEDVKKNYSTVPIDEHNELTVYLRHLRNADRMVCALQEFLGKRDKDAVMCFYGDHLPSLPAVFDQLAYDNNRTDYFIWHNKKRRKRQNVTLDAVNLAARLLDCATGK